MARAYKCDRCNILFEEEQDFEHKEDEALGLRIGKFTTWGFKAIDLCPLCQAKFEAWFDAAKELKEEEKDGK